MSDVVSKRGLTSLGIAVIVVAVALAAWQVAPEKAAAQAPPAGMGLGVQGDGVSCSGDLCAVPSGGAFQVAIISTLLPGQISGFGAEVMFGGLTYTLAPCADQVQVSPVAVCASLVGPAGQARLAVGSGVVPPLTPLDATDGGTLALLDVTCAAEGTFTMALTAVTLDATSAPFGAVYFDLTATEIHVTPQGTMDLDLENSGSAVPIAVADTIDVECGGAPPVTPPPPLSSPEGPQPTLVSTGSGGSDTGGGSSAWLLVGAGALLALVLSGFGLQRWHSSREA